MLRWLLRNILEVIEPHRLGGRLRHVRGRGRKEALLQVVPGILVGSIGEGCHVEVRAGTAPVSSGAGKKMTWRPGSAAKSNPMTSLGSLAAVAVVLAAPAARAGDGNGDIVSRARAVELAQLRLLSRAPVAMHTNGHFGDGKTTHTFESFRRVEYHADGAVSNLFERGQVDGKPATEIELRRAMGIKEDPKDHDDVLTWALAPLNSRDMEGSAVGPSAPGGYALRCRVKRDALVSVVVVIVDEKTGRKRAASIQMAGMKAKLADRLENVLFYGDDGAPDRFRSSFHFKLGWIERSAEISSERVAPAGAR